MLHEEMENIVYDQDVDNKDIKKVYREHAFDSTRVNGFPYYLIKIKDDRGNIKCQAIPKGNGDVVESQENLDSYRMTHGGYVFRNAASLCDEIAGKK